MKVWSRYLTKPDLLVSIHVNTPGVENISWFHLVQLSLFHQVIVSFSGTNFFGSILVLNVEICSSFF